MKDLPPPSVRALRWALAIPFVGAMAGVLVLVVATIPAAGRAALDDNHPIFVIPGILAGSVFFLPTYLPLFLFGWFAVRRWPWQRVRLMFLGLPPLQVLLTVAVLVAWTGDVRSGAYGLVAVVMLAVGYVYVAIALAAISLARRRAARADFP